VTTTRWPVHPAAAGGEALSSWLARLATALHDDVDALFADFGYRPGLISTPGADDQYAAYTRQYSILLPPGQRRRRHLPGWRA
jgi:hypothetical protein